MLEGTFGGNAKVDLGDGENSFFLDPGSQLTGKLTLRSGDGGDSVVLNGGATIVGAVKLDLGDGVHSSFFDPGSSVGGAVSIKGRDGSDSSFLVQVSRATCVSCWATA